MALDYDNFQVIIALADKTRQHIPYRNSMMTSVLRDSLGGNCMTTMIATCAIERKNLDVSISECSIKATLDKYTCKCNIKYGLIYDANVRTNQMFVSERPNLQSDT